LFLHVLFPCKNLKKSLITARMNSIIFLSLLDAEALPSYDHTPSRRTGMTHSIIGATAWHTRLVGMERRLAAILSADVQGYSRLMHEDETATIQTLTAYRRLMAALIRQYRGRVVDDPGDNLLAEFPSVVEAVQCAITIQRTLAARNAVLPLHRQMVFRMGLHLGDIVVEQERIYGAAVNLAARLERVAEGGGLCISGTVYDHVVAKLPLDCSAIGVWMGQGTPAPVRVYRVQIGATTRPSIRRLRAPHTRMVWPRARRIARAVLRYLGQCVGLWAEAANHPARVDNLWEQSLENRQNLIPRKRWQGARLRPSM
jgi:class 3 adenylate cyclase